MPRVIEAQAEDATSAAFAHAGGSLAVDISGTWGGTTAKLQRQIDPDSADSPPWVDVQGGTDWTADSARNFTAPPCNLRVVTTGGAGADLDVWISLMRG